MNGNGNSNGNENGYENGNGNTNGIGMRNGTPFPGVNSQISGATNTMMIDMINC